MPNITVPSTDVERMLIMLEWIRYAPIDVVLNIGVADFFDAYRPRNVNPDETFHFQTNFNVNLNLPKNLVHRTLAYAQHQRPKVAGSLPRETLFLDCNGFHYLPETFCAELRILILSLTRDTSVAGPGETS